ncbi:MAG: UDP-N-acetylmuramoyl-L-alanine--D-glutamate ligase [Aestuariivirgaceae bacterium]
MIAATRFKDKNVAVFGLARSGVACMEALIAGGARVHVWDDSETSIVAARKKGWPVSDLRDFDFSTLDNLVLSPGVPLTHPEPHWTVRRAREAGVEIIGDTEVFLRQIAGTGARVVAITGTNGKSTTTALIGHVLSSAGLDAHIGGNIGTAVFLLPPPGDNTVYVLEFSSYQIDLSPGLKPDVGILMNLSPDHLDRHGTMDNYAAVKARMFARQSAGDTAIVSLDDTWSAAIADTVSDGADLVSMSVEKDLDPGISAPDGIVHLRAGDEMSIDTSGIRTLRGRHNWQNACAAVAAAAALGIARPAIEKALRSFPGLAHRMEEVGRAGRVVFINDSKATNADAAAMALAAFDRIYWIAGGLAKSGGIEGLSAYFDKIVHAYLIGEAAEAFSQALHGRVANTNCQTLENAVRKAAADAGKDSAEEVAVLLSPACASVDQYPDFEKRGDAFCSAVEALDGVVTTKVEAA